MSQLIKLGRLQGEAIHDYLAYSVKIGQLAGRFDWISVLLYDREYRNLQACHEFRWGSDAPHLHTVNLRPKLAHQSSQNVGHYRGQGNRPTNFHQGQNQHKDRPICRLFNSAQGCHFYSCKFQHVCNIKGCGKSHTAGEHQLTAAKN